MFAPELLAMRLRIAAFLALAVTPLFAIPQNFNQGGGFVIANGMTFENFATDKGTFAPGATLKGEWSPPDASRVQTLNGDAVVFGLSAAEISAHRDAYRVTKFRVRYRQSGKNSRPLLDRVLQNVRAFTGGSSKAAENGAHRFQHGAAQISVRATAAKEVVVEFTPMS